MIRARRNAHVYMMTGLAGILPIVFLAGLLYRPAPTLDSAADGQSAAVDAPITSQASFVSRSTVVVNGIDVQVATAETTSGLVLLLTPTQALPFSDLLVYWSPGESPPTDVSADAFLLGQLSGSRRHQLPGVTEMQTESGYLLFYSRDQAMAIAAVPLSQSRFP